LKSRCVAAPGSLRDPRFSSRFNEVFFRSLPQAALHLEDENELLRRTTFVSTRPKCGRPTCMRGSLGSE
jgi:hypothetical protein